LRQSVFSIGVITFVPVLRRRIAHKNTFEGSRV